MGCSSACCCTWSCRDVRCSSSCSNSGGVWDMEDDGAARIRRGRREAAAAGSEVVTAYRGHKGGVTCVSFRPLMKHLVSGGADGSVLLWSLFCRRPLRRSSTHIRPYRFLGHQGEVCAIAVSPLDTVVASASKDKTVRLWIPTAEGRNSIIKAHSSTVRTVAFSPNGECLLTGSDDKAIKIWDVETERFLVGLNGHMNWVRSANFNSNGRLVVSGGDDKTVRIWDVAKHECIHVFNDVPSKVTCTRFHPYGSCIGTCGNDKAIQIWDIRSKTLIQHYVEDAAVVNSLSFHPSGNFLLSTSDDATLKVWDLREGQVLYVVKGHEDATTCVEFSPTGDHFASGSKDEQVMLWHTNLKQPQRTLEIGIVTPEKDFSDVPLHQSQVTIEGKPSSKLVNDHMKVSNPITLKTEATNDETKKRLHLPQNINQEQKNTKNCQKAQKNEHTKRVVYRSNPSSTSNSDDNQNCLDSKQAQALGVSLDNLTSQIDVLAKSILVFDKRLSHIEDKVLHMEKLKSM